MMANSTRAWAKLPIDILDDRKVATLPDKQWREYVMALIFSHGNIHIEGTGPRYTWLLARKKRRAEVFARDEHCCRNCGSIDNLEIDHIIPLARGGTNNLDNLQILCLKCNRKKWIY